MTEFENGETAHLHPVGIVSIDRLNTESDIRGTSRQERRRIGSLTARRNYLAVKLQDMPMNSHHYARAELSALDWALPILQAVFDGLNVDEIQDAGLLDD